MTGREAMECLQDLYKTFKAVENLKDALEVAAGAEQVAKEAQARRDAAEHDHKSFTAAYHREHAEFETWRKEVANAKAHEAVEHEKFRRKHASEVAHRTAEIAGLTNQRDALVAAIAALRASVAGV